MRPDDGSRGLDYLAVTDDDDVRSASAPGSGSHGVLAIPGYEDKVKGDAHVLGIDELLGHGDGSAAALNALAKDVRAKGGFLQIHHPGSKITKPFAGCDASTLTWGYGYDVQPDTIEVWNPGSSIRAAEDYLDCWLQRGTRVALTGGSLHVLANGQKLLDQHPAGSPVPMGRGPVVAGLCGPDRDKLRQMGRITATHSGRCRSRGLRNHQELAHEPRSRTGQP